MKTKQTIALIVIIGAIIFLSNYSNIIGVRSAHIIANPQQWDGFSDNFKITPVGGIVNPMISGGGPYTWYLNVQAGKTPLAFNQHMYVECGIYDQDTNKWLDNFGRQGIFGPDTIESESSPNCVKSETNVQTYSVLLSHGAIKQLTFTMNAPNIETKNAVVFCEAFEQCVSEGHPSMASSTFKSDAIEIKKSSTDKCGNKQLCKVEGETKCVNGQEATLACTKDAEGCMVWSNKTSCSSGNICMDDTCQAPEEITIETQKPVIVPQKTIWEWISSFFGGK